MSDYPDFFSQGVFPSYGVLTQITNTVTIASGVTSTIFNVENKGVLYFCHVESGVHAAFDDFTIIFTLDGFVLCEASFSTIFASSLFGRGSYPFACFSYIPETPYLVIGLTRIFPFGTQIKLEISNDNASDVRIVCAGAWAKVTK